MSNSLQAHGLQHVRLPCPLLSPGVCSNSCPLSWWCHITISSSAVPFSSCLQSFPASGSFPMNQHFTLGSQSSGASALASVLLINIQGWFPLGLAGLISLQSKGLSRIFSSTTVWKHQFLSARPWLDVCRGQFYAIYDLSSKKSGNFPWGDELLSEKHCYCKTWIISFIQYDF